MARARAVVIAISTGVAIIASVTGCGGTGADTGATADAETAKPALTRLLEPLTSPEVLVYCPDIEAVHLDADPGSVENVTVCSRETQPPDSATPSAVIERASRVESGADRLLDVYGEPDAPKTDGACIQLAADPLLVWIETSEGLTAVYAPVDECGFPTAAATEAYEALELSTLAEVEIPTGDATPKP